MIVFWRFTPRGSSYNSTFRRTYRLHLQGDRTPQLCYRRITVDQPPHRGTLCRAKEDFLVVCLHGGITPCGSS
jgi:hypothetical protein